MWGAPTCSLLFSSQTLPLPLLAISRPPQKKVLTRIGSCLLYAYALNTYTPVVRPRNIADAYKTENKLGLVHTTQWSLLTRFFAFLFETRMV